MALYNQDITIEANTDIKITIRVINESNGLPTPQGDIEGASWAITPFEDEVSPLITKDLSTGGIEVPEDGVVVVKILKSDTVGLSGEFSHELKLSDASGDVSSASRGKLTIKYQIANNPL